MKLKNSRTFVISAIALSLFAGAGLAVPASAAETATHYITISATGSTSVVPDAVRINANVSVVGATSKEALASASTSSAAVRAVLVANKISKKDFSTQSITVYPEYTYPANSNPVISGYRASQSFNIVVRATATAGDVVDAIVEAGGDNVQINGVSPFVLDNSKATVSARAAAVKSAKAKAKTYASLLGIKLGKIIFFEESSTPTYYPMYAAAAKADGMATQVDLGEQKVTVSVTIHWAL